MMTGIVALHFDHWTNSSGPKQPRSTSFCYLATCLGLGTRFWAEKLSSHQVPLVIPRVSIHSIILSRRNTNRGNISSFLWYVYSVNFLDSQYYCKKSDISLTSLLHSVLAGWTSLGMDHPRKGVQNFLLQIK